MLTKSDTDHPENTFSQKPGGVSKIFTETGECEKLVHCYLRLLDRVQDLIQDCFKQFYVLFGGGFPTKFFGVFWTTLSKFLSIH